MMRRVLAALMSAGVIATPSVATASDGAADSGTAAAASDPCAFGICQVRVTPEQLLAQAESLVRQRRFAEAEPMIAALAQAPRMKLPSRFLAGYAASEKGDYKQASAIFKNILSDDPAQTRVRLELARAMLGLGQTASADRQFRIAEQSGDLPPDIAATIRGARQVIRSRRAWRLDVDVGIAPDSNINNATGASQIDINLGDVTLPVALNDDARAQSGTGQTGTLSAGVRLPFGGNKAVLAGLDAGGTNYRGADFDDWSVQGTAGGELHLSDTRSVSLEGVVARRWFGGREINRQFGLRAGGQLMIGDSSRLGLQIDGRRTIAGFDDNYSGWQTGLYANAEHSVARTLVASAGLFARRDGLTAAAFSNTELGASLGLGGELPLGITFGVGGSVSRAMFDAPMPLFSADARRDWRYGGRLTLGNRKLRAFGFSPQVTLSYTRNASTVRFFDTDRLRLRFAVARYF